ncbi:MAG: hypothetical protein K2N43_05040, partial [Lachnospiraceae bacterium]|nr:hypothetical protein [Lachnospiraceae bacterium]
MSPALPAILNQEVSWRVISPRKGFTVYISEKKYKPEFSSEPSEELKPEVVVCVDDGYYRLDVKDYCLDFCEPIVMFRPRGYRYNGPGLEVLSIVLPLEDTSDAVSPIGAYEVYGREYVVSCWKQPNGRQEWRAQEVIPGGEIELTAGRQVNTEGKEMFTLTVDSWFEDRQGDWGEGIFWYPELELSAEDCSLIYEEAAHYTENGVGYRRVSVATGDEQIYVGKFCGNVFFPDEEKGYYCEHGRAWAVNGPYLQKWQARPLEPEALLDLDGDGVEEKLAYRLEEDHTCSKNFVITINGQETELQSSHELFGNYMFTASLDGKANQLLVLDFEDGRSRVLKIYSYIDGKLCEAGQFPYADYNMEEKDGRWIYSAFKRVYPLQNDIVLMDYSMIDGVLQEIPRKYYEFLEYWSNDNGEPERNIFTAKQDFLLYTQKGGTET